ncbi:MAG: glycosyltransferase family 4 protein [Candidatus Scalindua sp.]|nr:glycosyltransferase family 4 protein [Candidatus Scalindua sp.]
MLNYEFPPMGGGAGSATYNIAKELVKMGHSVDVLTSKIENQKAKEVLDGINVFRVFSWRNSIHDCGLKGAYSYLFFAALKIRKLCKKNRYDVLHYFFSLPTGLLSLLPGIHRKIPYIVSLRGSDVPYYDTYSRKVHVFHMILKPVNKYIWKRAKKIVALSWGLKLTAQRTAPELHMEVIPNGVETDIFKPIDQEKYNSKNLNLITVSRLINRKGINHILEALSKLNDKKITLMVVGIGNYEKNLKDLCKKLMLNDVVTFHGYHPREKLSELYNKADVFILPSLAESFGLVFAEAMACRLPIIGGRTGGVPDLVKEENGILVEPGNIKEIQNAILEMRDNIGKRLLMGEANRKRVLNHYSWKYVAKRYFDIYQDTLNIDTMLHSSK